MPNRGNTGSSSSSIHALRRRFNAHHGVIAANDTPALAQGRLRAHLLVSNADRTNKFSRL
jgi:hypothetical protein